MMSAMGRGLYGLSILLGCGGAAAQDVPFSARYDFYIGGLTVAEIALDGSVGATGYDARSRVETRGLLDLLTGGRIDATAAGDRRGAGRFVPDAYANDFVRGGTARRTSMTYSGDIARVSIFPPEAPKPTDTTPEAHPNTLDPVTAVVAMMTPRPGNSLCNRTIPIFDGKRRYDIVLLSPKDRTLGEEPPIPDWDRPVTRCFGVYERIAGFDRALQTEQRYFPFDIWFERHGSGGVHRIVRLAGKTRLGYAIGMLRR